MTTKHTPGPWVIQHLESHKNGYPNWDTYCIRSGRTNCHLATVGDVDRHEELHAKANAILLSAAPVLLAALSDLVEYAADCAAERDERPVCIATARAAIAKAGGGEP